MKIQIAIKTLDAVIPKPDTPIVDAEHMKIAMAWATVRKAAEWVSVRDRLPEDQVEVLVCTRSKNGGKNVDKGYWSIDHFIHRGVAQVTHWMPLPELPEDTE